jgi:hypothetical protein
MGKIQKIKKPTRKISKKREADMKVYRKLRKQFLAENPWCQVIAVVAGHRVKTTDIHHTRGRAGSLFLDQRFWLAVSRPGHEWIQQNPLTARRLGFICETGKWNTPERS